MDASTIAIWILSAAACYFLADYKNRATTHWTIMGLLFGFLAFIWLLFMSKLPEEGVDTVENK